MTLADGALFADDWLARREPLDHASRAHGLARAIAAHLAQRPAAGQPPSVVDLGAGGGSNWRYLSRFLPQETRWTLVDHDTAHITRLSAARDARLTIRQADLANPLEPLIAGADLVSAAALLDLVSTHWIAEFATVVAHARACLLIALSVDGSIRFDGRSDAKDDALRRALVRDQRRDKGLGEALGPLAPHALVNALSHHGYAITSMPSPWHIDDRHLPLAEQLLAGWAEAAARARPAVAGDFADWASRRLADIANRRTRVVVGHVDILALPGPRAHR